MSERPASGFAFPVLGCMFVAIALNAGCGNAPLGHCVSLNVSGSRSSLPSTRTDCAAICSRKLMGDPGGITSCYFQPLLLNPVEPRD